MSEWSKQDKEEDHFARGSCVPRLWGGVRARKQRGEATDSNSSETTRERARRSWSGVCLRRNKGLFSIARGARRAMFFGHTAKRPHPSRVQPPLLPTPMDEPDSVFRSKQPACVVGGRASGGRGSRPFPRALQGASAVAGLQHCNDNNNTNEDDGGSGAFARRPAAVATDAAAAGTTTGVTAAIKPSRRAQRGVPLVQWVWPANSGIARVGSEWFRGAAANSKQVAQENPPMRLQGRTQKSSVVVGTVCEPVRPTRLDLSASKGEGELRNRRQVIYCAGVVRVCVYVRCVCVCELGCVGCAAPIILILELGLDWISNTHPNRHFF